jgi:hypothetical protein
MSCPYGPARECRADPRRVGREADHRHFLPVAVRRSEQYDGSAPARSGRGLFCLGRLPIGARNLQRLAELVLASNESYRL